jgi:hypothetical protein
MQKYQIPIFSGDTHNSKLLDYNSFKSQMSYSLKLNYFLNCNYFYLKHK